MIDSHDDTAAAAEAPASKGKRAERVGGGWGKVEGGGRGR